MVKIRSVLTSCLLLTLVTPAVAQDYSVEIIDGTPETDDVSAELTSHLAEQGYRVKRGSRTICEVWLCKQWTVDPDFAATQERLYPFNHGQLLGVLHYSRRGNDFRDQSISSGWYTLRFALQPVDGNHVGTSLTRDFVVMVEAGDDAADKDWDARDLNLASSAAAGSTHPAMLCLQKGSDGADAAVLHNEEHDWWILHVNGQSGAGDAARNVPLDLVVVGHALE